MSTESSRHQSLGYSTVGDDLKRDRVAGKLTSRWAAAAAGVAILLATAACGLRFRSEAWTDRNLISFLLLPCSWLVAFGAFTAGIVSLFLSRGRRGWFDVIVALVIVPASKVLYEMIPFHGVAT